MRRNFLSSVSLVTITLFVLIVFAGMAKAQVSDKVLAVVGRNRIILQSELEMQAEDAAKRDPAGWNDTMRCSILQQMILSKMLMEQAERDSLLVSDDEVENQLDNKLRYFISSVYGSKEKLEEVTGKTVYQIKEDNREIIREQMMSEKVRGKILEHVTITPVEVKAFYNKIPADSLPFFPATVEMGQIVIDPPVSPEMSDYAYKKLEDIRNQIVKDGKSFEVMAGIYSGDPGSRDNGGRVDGVTRTGGWAPEFVVATFKLQPDQISPIIKTQFGYHIIQLIARKGDQADVRHILIIPERTTADFKRAMDKLDSVRAELITGKLSFPQAVGKYSTDEQSKFTGGMITDQRTGSSHLQIDQLDPTLALMVDSIKVGGFSQPQVFTKATGDRSCRIVFMKDRTEPHKANLKDDYGKIQEVATMQKQSAKLEQWITEKLPTYYLKIDSEYTSCSTFNDWKKYLAK